MMNNEEMPKRTIYIFLLLFVVSLFSSLHLVEAQNPEDCVQGYQGGYLERGKKPRFGRALLLCDEDYRTQALARSLRFIRLSDHPITGPGIDVIIEIISDEADVIHLLRSGTYFGEFIEDKKTKSGRRTQRISMILERVPIRANQSALDPGAFKYFYTVGDYVWSKTHVQRIKRVTRLVRMGDGAELIPMSPKKLSLVYRRVIDLGIEKAPVPFRADNREELVKRWHMPIFVRIHYWDPVLERKVFFRTFEVKEKRHKTIVPFIRTRGSQTADKAIISLYRDGNRINEFEMQDPGVDNLELNLNVGL